MSHPVIDTLEGTKRPKLFMNAAKLACSYYRRDVDLWRIVNRRPRISQSEIVNELIALEHGFEQQRQSQHTAYIVADHVNCMAALLSEAQLLLHPVTNAA